MSRNASGRTGIRAYRRTLVGPAVITANQVSALMGGMRLCVERGLHTDCV